MLRSIISLITVSPVFLASCASPPPSVAITAAAQHPATFFGRTIRLCGDPGGAYQSSFDGKTYGFPLYSPNGEGSVMHGRVGVFVPRRPGMDLRKNAAVCVTGRIVHASGKTPAEVARQTGQYYTSSAVDDQWWFEASDATRSARPARLTSSRG
ncbi:hypothetical protein [Sphingomonas sp. Leaf25]|uniref:hypothetical protein n=1 Tax=Sphingomonas sp. Leaf25 TaxID=1735692 RepID=UPI0006F88A85|nr:hypothetical protein [Sphingomonas sp. Leaf25]KQN07201.1 hypothetical protein ASE78_13340 [Sphingomonas sp. Leaf25]